MEVLRTYLERKNVTQKELARLVGVTQPSIAKWFQVGRIPPHRVRTVEAITGIPAAKLAPELFGKRTN